MGQLYIFPQLRALCHRRDRAVGKGADDLSLLAGQVNAIVEALLPFHRMVPVSKSRGDGSADRLLIRKAQHMLEHIHDLRRGIGTVHNGIAVHLVADPRFFRAENRCICLAEGLGHIIAADGTSHRGKSRRKIGIFSHQVQQIAPVALGHIRHGEFHHDHCHQNHSTGDQLDHKAPAPSTWRLPALALYSAACLRFSPRLRHFSRTHSLS